MQLFCQSLGGGVPCKRNIIYNNMTLKSANPTFWRFALRYIIKSCNYLNISYLAQNINTLGVY